MKYVVYNYLVQCNISKFFLLLLNTIIIVDYRSCFSLLQTPVSVSLRPDGAVAQSCHTHPAKPFSSRLQTHSSLNPHTTHLNCQSNTCTTHAGSHVLVWCINGSSVLYLPLFYHTAVQHHVTLSVSVSRRLSLISSPSSCTRAHFRNIVSSRM